MDSQEKKQKKTMVFLKPIPLDTAILSYSNIYNLYNQLSKKTFG